MLYIYHIMLITNEFKEDSMADKKTKSTPKTPIEITDKDLDNVAGGILPTGETVQVKAGKISGPVEKSTLQKMQQT